MNATGHDKTYDGTTDATVDLAGVGLVTGDEVTFEYTAATYDSADVGTDIPVDVQGISISGADAANYQLESETAEATGSISPAALAITATDQSKLYGDTFVFTGTEFTAGGLVAGEAIDTVTLTCDGSGATQAPGTYADRPIRCSAARGHRPRQLHRHLRERHHDRHGRLQDRRVRQATARIRPAALQSRQHDPRGVQGQGLGWQARDDRQAQDRA